MTYGFNRFNYNQMKKISLSVVYLLTVLAALSAASCIKTNNCSKRSRAKYNSSLGTTQSDPMEEITLTIPFLDKSVILNDNQSNIK